MSKIIKFDREAKEKLQAGIKKVHDAVTVTMGPFGRNVLIEKEHGQVTSTKDGVTVAKTIALEDPIENMGATVIKQAAQKTVDQAGDGTTTSTLLAYNIANQALELTSKPSVNVTQVKYGIEAAIKNIVSELKSMSVDITDEKQIKQIATLSSNGDEEIGELVATAIDKVGRDGIVTVEESRSGETSLEVVEGLQFDRGYKSPYMVIAEDIDGEALSTLIVNKMRGILKVVAVKAPDFGDRRTLILEDIAVVTGGTLVSPQKGMKLDKFNMSWLGNARTVTVGKETTTLVDGKGETEKIDARIEELKAQIDQASSPYEVERLQDRLAKIVGGVAIINVGGGTEVEMKERKDRIDDALQATKAALEEGIVPGAGMALFTARNAIKDRDNSDVGMGGQIVYKACSSPLNKILTNAGEDYHEWASILKEKNAVPDIVGDRTIDAFKSGIIDPTKVVRCALENAAAAAVTLLMTECVIHDKPTDKKKEEVDLSSLGM